MRKLGAQFKIFSLVRELPAISRPVPALDLSSADALANFSNAFGELPNLGDAAARAKRNELGLNVSCTTAVIDGYFTDRTFTKSLNDKVVRQACAYFAEELIARGRLAEAKHFLSRLIEQFGALPLHQYEKVGFLFLKAQTETDLNQAYSAYSGIFSLSGSNAILWHLIRYYLCGRYRKAGQKDQALMILAQQPAVYLSTSSHNFPEALADLLRDSPAQARRKVLMWLERHPQPSSAEEALFATLYKNILATASVRLGDLETVAGLDATLYFDHKSRQAVQLALGEAALKKGDSGGAERLFRQAAGGFEKSLHAVTRLNELAWQRGAAPQPLIGQLDEEIRLRQPKADSAAPEEIMILLTQKLTLARRAGLSAVAEEAIKQLAEAVPDGPLRPAVLAFCAAQPTALAKVRKALRRTAMPRTVEAATAVQRSVVQQLFGTDNPVAVAQSAKELKRRLMSSEPTTLLAIADLPAESVGEMLAVYQAREGGIRSRATAFWQDLTAGRALLFSGEVINAYRLISASGLASFRFVANRAEGTVTVRLVNHQDEYFEAPLSANFNLTLTRNHEYYRLLSLVVLDFFLKVQLGENYQAVFEMIDFKFFTESEFLNARTLANRVAALISRPPSPSEAALEAIETEEMQGTVGVAGTGPAAEPPDEEALDERKQIYKHKTHRLLLEAKRVVIDLPELSSLDPLAQFIDAVAADADGSNVRLVLHAGASKISIAIDPEGNIAIADYNRGLTNLALIQRLKMVILDQLNAHFLPEYWEALGKTNHREIIRNMFIALQNSVEAQQRKWEIFQELDQAERIFEIQPVAGQSHPFASVFFEEKERESERPLLIPLPEMKELEAQREAAIGRRIVQVVACGIHRRRHDRQIGDQRLDYYLARHILGINKQPTEWNETDRRKIESIKTRILGGELTADPNGFLQPDRDRPNHLTMDSFLEITRDGGNLQSLRAHYTFVRRQLKRIPAGNFRVSRPVAPATPEPAAPAPPKPKPKPKPRPAATSEVPPPATLADENLARQVKMTENAKSFILGLKNKEGLEFDEIAEESGVPLARILQIAEGKQLVEEAELLKLRLFYMRQRFGSREE